MRVFRVTGWWDAEFTLDYTITLHNSTGPAYVVTGEAIPYFYNAQRETGKFCKECLGPIPHFAQVGTLGVMHLQLGGVGWDGVSASVFCVCKRSAITLPHIATFKLRRPCLQFVPLPANISGQNRRLTINV